MSYYNRPIRNSHAEQVKVAVYTAEMSAAERQPLWQAAVALGAIGLAIYLAVGL